MRFAAVVALTGLVVGCAAADMDAGSSPTLEPARSNWVEVLGSRMHYVEAGQGTPILLLHGQPTSSYLWRRVIPGLASSGRVIALDLIGFGLSDRPDIDYGLEDHTRYLAAFIEALNLEGMVIVGHDWGSYLGAQYAVDHREEVRGLVFMEAILAGGGNLAPPLGDGILVRRAAEAIRVIVSAARADSAELSRLIEDENVFVERFLPTGTMRTLTRAELDAYREPFRDPASRRPMARFPQEIPNPDVGREIVRYTEALREWSVPKLLLTVEPGVLFPAEVVEWARSSFSGLTVVDLGLGLHFVQEDHPEEIAAVTAEWMRATGLTGPPTLER